MSIRLRLAFWYGALFAIVLPLVTVFCYALHTHSQYDDLDQSLVTSASHAAIEASTSPGDPRLGGKGGGLDIALRLYAPDSVLRESSPGADIVPMLAPHTSQTALSSSSFDFIAGLVPSFTALPPIPDAGTFRLLTSSGQRWRYYIVPFYRNGRAAGHIEAIASLKRIDGSIQNFRFILVAINLVGVTVAFVGSRIIAQRALHPLTRMTQTAQTIALSRDFSHRIDVPPNRDELGYLARTFNHMLESLESAYRMQQRFVSDASHELRAPLTAIRGNLELLRHQRSLLETEREDALAEAEQEATRLTRLVADLLSLARADAGISFKRVTIDLDAIVLETFHEAHQLSTGQTLILDPFEPASIEGNADRLKQLLLILLDNALKYTPADGWVTLGLQRKGAFVEVLVRDTGIGIAPEDMPHIFERFYRADQGRGRDPGGVGLGLSIALWIVEQHDGQITLESLPDQGTTALVRLPLNVPS